MYKLIYLALLLVLTPAIAKTQQGIILRKAAAVRTSQAPKIDGKIGDSVWQQATPLTDFIINSPDFGKPSKLNTKVWVLYDDVALYIAAKLQDDPKLIRKQLTARDGEQRQDVDYFAAYIDTYNDNQNGFQFAVTSRNVQSDGRLSPPFKANLDHPVIIVGMRCGKVMFNLQRMAGR